MIIKDRHAGELAAELRTLASGVRIKVGSIVVNELAESVASYLITVSNEAHNLSCQEGALYDRINELEAELEALRANNRILPRK